MRFEAALAKAADVEGWLTEGQARRLYDTARVLDPPATIVEIGTYRGRSAIILATAAADGVEVVAIDPHAGNDRGPQQIAGTMAEGEADHAAFRANLERAGVAGRVRHVRRPSQEAFDAVGTELDLLYVDGAHRYRPASADITRWGERVRPGGRMLIHDAFASIGVTLAIIRHLLWSRDFAYTGRTGSLAEYHRRPQAGAARLRNALRQLAEMPWFARNVLVKVAIALRLRSSREWPY